MQSLHRHNRFMSVSANRRQTKLHSHIWVAGSNEVWHIIPHDAIKSSLHFLGETSAGAKVTPLDIAVAHLVSLDLSLIKEIGGIKGLASHFEVQFADNGHQRHFPQDGFGPRTFYHDF